MRLVDTPISRLWGRTARELLIIVAGIALCALELARPGTNPVFLAVYATCTSLFAIRFYAARVAAVGLLVSCLVLPLLCLRMGKHWDSPASHLWWGFWAALPIFLLLLSSDLRQRFDRGPRRSGWRTNHWRDLPRSHWMASCMLGYLFGLLGNMVYGPWYWSGTHGVWPLLIAFGATGVVILLFLGRSIAFLLATIVAGTSLYMIWPHVAAAEAYTADLKAGPPSSILWAWAPGYALPAVIAAVCILVLAVPYATLHVVRSLRS